MNSAKLSSGSRNNLTEENTMEKLPTDCKIIVKNVREKCINLKPFEL